MLAGANVHGVRVHKLAPLAAWFMHERGEPIPPAFATAERGASVARLAARPLLERIRASCDGPLVLIKGPEVAGRYPGQSRYFFDVDLLVPDPWETQRALLAAGFVEDGEFYEDAQHLRPLRWPLLGLKVEIHKHPSWPKRLEPPRPEEILEAALPSACGVEGIDTADPARHALIVAAHAWKEDPLGTMRDLVDVAALAADASEPELDRLADAWGLGKVWRTTRDTAHAVIEGQPLPRAVRVWARHLETLRERTLLESYLRQWLQGFWKLPPRDAWLETRDAVRRQLRPRAGEPRRRKLRRSAYALLHVRRPHSVHDREARKRAGSTGLP